MATGKNTLWSTDLFPPNPRSAVTSSAAPSGMSAVDPDFEAIYLAYANPVLRLAAAAGPSGVRMTELVERLASMMPDFDVADLRTALDVLVDNKRMLDMVERDRKLGNNLYAINTLGLSVIRL